MNHIDTYYQLTKEMLDLFDQYPESDKRDDLIEEINRLLQERQEVTDLIQPPFTQDERALSEEIYQLDQQLDKKLNRLFKRIKTDLQNTKKQQKSTPQYMNPYKNVATYDGTFLDSRK
ncbi:flagellin-specific chaperone FliT [Gracilibacillus halophilus YIM-C55.5]|uniref:Flagellar protein FliT n=1 Tax=Gracilibacillus halophilus YIM-C55.5 TaxID=1308866 RepID=N4WGN9_9BACI|nr:flagellar protein FliT [Gracilibacillus halophilus]ENH98419.1 flagellin-specific chaperone FliT [Gracilibacillus halophilus YIM-C55.5]